METGAKFSDCKTYRYALWRYWNKRSQTDFAMFIGLNPSTADEVEDDPTIRRCIRFAKDWDYGGLVMLNAYAFRATDPKVMKAALAPIGPENDAALRKYGQQAGIIVAAWGAHCKELREQQICESIDRKIHCLGVTKHGRPKHPLYLRADTQPEVFWSP